MPLKFYLLACLVLELIELRLLQSPRQIIVIACYKGKESQEIGHEAKEEGGDDNKNETVLSLYAKGSSKCA